MAISSFSLYHALSYIVSVICIYIVSEKTSAFSESAAQTTHIIFDIICWRFCSWIGSRVKVSSMHTNHRRNTFTWMTIWRNQAKVSVNQSYRTSLLNYVDGTKWSNKLLELKFTFVLNASHYRSCIGNIAWIENRYLFHQKCAAIDFFVSQFLISLIPIGALDNGNDYINTSP